MPEFTLFVHNDMVNQSNILIIKLYNYTTVFGCPKIVCSSFNTNSF